MNSPIVYLAGPIAGHDPDLVRNRHLNSYKVLADQGITALSPLRDCLGLLPVERVDRDYADIRACDLVFADFTYWRDECHVSVGTCHEMGYATALSKLLVMAWPAKRPHGLVNPFLGYRASIVFSYEEGLDKVIQLLARKL